MLTTQVTSARTYGRMIAAATCEWFSGDRSSPMSCNQRSDDHLDVGAVAHRPVSPSAASVGSGVIL